jgi:4-hydroxybenzoate polyprenyltransferase
VRPRSSQNRTPETLPQGSPGESGVAVPGEAPAVPGSSRPYTLLDRALALATALRPTQWTKNGLVLLALVFARRLGDLGAAERVLLAFFSFSLAASAVYIVNDLTDRERDRVHPRKRLRPIASGRVTPVQASVLAALCLAGAEALTWLLVRDIPLAGDPFAGYGGSPALFIGAIGSYVLLNVAYSRWLKHEVLLDVFIIAAGFVLRALAGAFAAPVPISPWFYLCVTFGALFLALGKRRAELILLSESAGSHRRNLQEYTLHLLDQLLVVVVTCTLISYSLYTFQGENASHALMLTIPLVLYGIFRYLYLVYVKLEGDRPDELLWRDPQLLATVILWGLVVAALLYGIPHLRALM